MRQPHPTDLTLAAAVDGHLEEAELMELRHHVESCGRCQLCVAQSDPAVDTAQRGRPDLPEVVITVNETRDENPVRGDVWRLAWDSVVLLAVILDEDQDRFRVLPVLDSCDADEWCTLLSALASGGLGDMAVSTALESTIPRSVLDARVGRLPDMGPITRLRTEYRTGESDGMVLRGEPIRSSRDERLVALDELNEELTFLSNAVWTPDAAGQPGTSQISPDMFEEVAEALSTEEALAIYRGAPVTDRQAQRIEQEIGTRPASAPVPAAVISILESPTIKHKIRERARRFERSEASERQELAHSLCESGVAARGAQASTAVDYDVILDKILDE